MKSASLSTTRSFMGSLLAPILNSSIANLLAETLVSQSLGPIGEVAYALFRFYIGISIAIGAGWAKVPVETHGWFVDQVSDIGFTFISPVFWATIAIYGEFIGGLLIAVGLLTRFASFQLAFQFFVVSFIWYSEPEFMTGMYYQQLIFWTFVLSTVMGGGKLSLDYLLVKRLRKPLVN